MKPAAAAPALPTDELLVDARAHNHAQVFEQVMRRYNRRLFRVARAILKDDDEAQDAVQDGYLAAFRNLAGFRGAAQLGTWLTRIVINESFARIRKRKRDARILPFASDEPGIAVDEVSEMATDRRAEAPDDAAARAQLRRVLEQRIDALPEQFRTVFILREVDPCSSR